MPSARGRLILIVATIALVAPAPAAHAKGLALASVCGADGCTDITQRAQGPRDCAGCSAEQLLTAMPGSAHPSRRAPYVRLVLGFGEPGGKVQGREPILWSPELQLAARSDSGGGWDWFQAPGEALAVAHRLARGIRPYPAAGMPLGRPALTGPLVPAPAAPAASASASGDSGGLPLPDGAAVLAAGLGLAALAAVHRRRRDTAAAAG